MVNALIVDDKPENLYLLEVILRGRNYHVQSAANGAEALELARKSPPEIIIADILMPVMDGFALCREWKSDERLKSIPFVFYTATYTDARDRQFAMDLGADQFITKPTEPLEFLEKINQVMDRHKAGRLNGGSGGNTDDEIYLKEYNEALIRKLEDKMADLEKTNAALRASEAELRASEAALLERESALRRSSEALVSAYESTLEGWSRALDLRDSDTNGHTERTVTLSVRLARVLGLPEEDVVQIRRGALLHDIGKMAIPDSILLKPGPLTEAEWMEMRKHPTNAYELLSSIEFLRPALDIPYYHHEKWDGTGYPHGLKGEEIPLSARIFALVDVWDALSSGRPYRQAWSAQEIRAYFAEQAGYQFDPAIVPVFLKMMEEA